MNAFPAATVGIIDWVRINAAGDQGIVMSSRLRGAFRWLIPRTEGMTMLDCPPTSRAAEPPFWHRWLPGSDHGIDMAPIPLLGSRCCTGRRCHAETPEAFFVLTSDAAPLFAVSDPTLGAPSYRAGRPFFARRQKNHLTATPAMTDNPRVTYGETIRKTLRRGVRTSQTSRVADLIRALAETPGLFLRARESRRRTINRRTMRVPGKV